jgi:predicted DNA-binding transcriptional regulator AlpA
MTATAVSDDGCSEHSNRYLSAPKVIERLGVSQMTLWRWLHNPAMRFPKPHRFSRNRHWNLCELIAWEKANKEQIS